MPTVQKVGEFVILKIQDDVRCERPICNSVKTVAIAQYESIKSVLEQTIDCQGWLVSQKSFISGQHFLNDNEKDFHDI